MKWVCCFSLLLASVVCGADVSLFDQKNLAAWCIVPFDKAKRGPEERAAMLEKLGFTKFVYDYRKEHIPTFDAELEALKKHHVELTGWWFPTQLNDEANMTLELFKRHGVKPVLWISGGGERPKTNDERESRLAAEVARVRPIADAAQAHGLKVDSTTTVAGLANPRLRWRSSSDWRCLTWEWCITCTMVTTTSAACGRSWR